MAISKITLNGVTQMDVTQKTVTANTMLDGVTSLKNDGTDITGNIASKTSSDLTISGATVTASAGYYGSAASKTIPNVQPYVAFENEEFLTVDNARMWRVQPFAEVDAGEGDTPGYFANERHINGDYLARYAVPANTSVTPTESSQTIGGSKYMMEGAVTVNAIPSNYVGSGITQRSSSDLTASGATVTAPAGYYGSAATKTVASGTAGTPTATKGTVSNHAISVTPSVTNTTGYITGGTKTGNAVSVSASELVSGTKNITSSGTTDVTNYASASVAAGTEGTPTATKGTVSGNQVTVTPSVTNSAGYISGGTHTGTGVTVAASELVSGSQTITESGTFDVTNLASVVVDIPSEGDYYMGVDLTTKFASEITASGGDPWAWIKSRITDGNYNGLHLGDYIPFTATNGNQRDAKIIGINTYTKYYSTEIGNHIDFWAGFWGQKAFNLAAYNNGTSVSTYPWLASDAYLFANSLSGSVPTSSSANPTLGARDHTSGGIYYYLPTALKNVIAEKKVLMGKRYTSGSLLTDDNDWGWTSVGKMWFPHEIEIAGMSHFTKPGYETGGFIHYPFFKSMENRLTFGRMQYWLISPSSGSSDKFGCVSSYGNITEASAVTSTVCYAPVCFRVA